MEIGPQLEVSSNRLEKPGIQPVTPGLHGEQFIHYITVSPRIISAIGSFSLTVALPIFFVLKMLSSSHALQTIFVMDANTMNQMRLLMEQSYLGSYCL